MTLLKTLNKKAMIGMMIAATGLPASIASGQFQVEYSAKSDAETVVNKEKTSTKTIYTDHDGEHLYKIKIVDGEVETANLDGKEFNLKQIELKDNMIVFLTKDGGTLHEIKLHQIKEGAHAPHADHDSEHDVQFWSSADGTFEIDGDNAFFVNASAAFEDEKHIIKKMIAEPKVMLGINLSEPSAALRKHLKLKDGVQCILVERVIEGLPAQKAGLEDFDIIVSIDGSDQASGEILGKVLSTKEAGETMKLIVLRSGDKHKLKVKLTEYNAQALGNIVITDNIELSPLSENDNEHKFEFNFEILDLLEEGKFGNIEKRHLDKLKNEIHRQVGEHGEQRIVIEQMRSKAMDAMKDAERQMLQFRNGKLFVHAQKEADELDIELGHLQGKLYEAFKDVNPEILQTRLSELDVRLEELDSRLNEQMDRMGEQMDRLAIMFERLMESLEDRD